ncbi:MAG: cache domain-containing protein [Spirochaetes bacterium]|nr:cache domain-containing protein [Spirochaetota bacterium]
MKKKLFIRLYTERDSRNLVPGSERATELVRILLRDEVKKIYILAPNHSVSRPYMDLFQKQVPGIIIRDLVMVKIERRDIFTIKSIIDDINASIRNGQNCEIILFNGSLAAVVLACFHVNAGRDAALSIEEARRVNPNVLISGSDVAFINDFHDYVRGSRPAATGLHAAHRSPSAPEMAGTVAPVGARKLQDVNPKEIEAIRRFIKQEEPAGILSRFRIATKLVALVSLLLVAAMSLVIFLGTAFFKKESRSRIHDSQSTIARLIGDRMTDEIVASIEKARNAARVSSIGKKAKENRGRAKEMLFGEKKDFIFMGVAGRDGEGLKFKKTFYNEEYINETGMSRDALKAVHRNNAGYFRESFDRRIVVRNVSPDAGTPVLGISFPYRYRKGSVSSVVVCYLPLEALMEATRITGPSTAYMVNDRGDCIVDAERNRVLSRVNMADVPVVRKMLLGTSGSGAMRFRDEEGRYQLASFAKLDAFGLGVIVTAGEDPMLGGVYDIQRRNFIILAIILVAAALGAFVFSRTISAPVEALKQIAASAPAVFPRLTLYGEGDEVYCLARSFRGMLGSYVDSLEGSDESRFAEHGVATAEPAGVAKQEETRDAVSQQFSTEGLKIQVTYDGPGVSMVWMGRGNLANPGELLNPYLEGIINSLRGRELVCDFSSLEAMNAAMVQSIIRFAYALDENRVRARFVYNRSIDWQDASFEALGAVVQEMETISLDGRMLEKNTFVLR